MDSPVTGSGLPAYLFFKAFDPTDKDKTVVRFRYEVTLENLCRPVFSTDENQLPRNACPNYDGGCNMDGVEWDPWKEGWERTLECHFDAVENIPCDGFCQGNFDPPDNSWKLQWDFAPADSNPIPI
jgi:hypothetical protein